jgi:hypothetical protein
VGRGRKRVIRDQLLHHLRRYEYDEQGHREEPEVGVKEELFGRWINGNVPLYRRVIDEMTILEDEVSYHL